MPISTINQNGLTNPLTSLAANTVGSASGSALTLQSNGGTTAVTINTSQNVGIGTTSPAAPLDIVSDSNSSAISVRGRSADNLSAIRIYSNNGATQYGVIRGAADELRVNATEAIPLTFYTNNSERMRITSAGDLLVGSSSSYAGKNQSWGAVTANASTPNFAAIDTTSVASGVGGELAFFGQFQSNEYAYMGSVRGIKENGTSGNTACALTFSTRPTATAPTERMRISSGGLISMGTSGVANNQRLTLYASTNQWGVGGTASSDTFSILNNGGAGVALSWGSTSWSGVSDEKLKNITGEINNGISKVCSLRAAEFTWKSDEENKPQVGLIAQDVQKVLPEAVSEENDVLAIRYTEVIPLLVAAIKELKAEFDEYKRTHP